MSATAADLARPGRVPLVEVVITEELDASAVPRLRGLLDDALALRPEQLVVDLVGCRLIDAAAIAVLLDVHRQAIRGGGQLSLRGPSARLRRNLELARAAHVLRITGADAGVRATEWSAAATSAAAAGGQPIG